MNRYNAAQELFEVVTVLEKRMLFTCIRIDRGTVPKGLFVYEVRHDDDQQGMPVQIAEWIMVNHWGTLISAYPVNLKKDAIVNNSYRDINPDEDWGYEGITFTLKQYIDESSGTHIILDEV